MNQRDLGNLAATETRGVSMSCDACCVRWVGCAAVHECPECGRPQDWWPAPYELPEEQP